jgi:hypothetical protein
MIIKTAAMMIMAITGMGTMITGMIIHMPVAIMIHTTTITQGIPSTRIILVR